MTVVLKIGNRSITAEQVLSLMAGYQMLPQFLQEILIDQATAAIEATPEEVAAAREQFYAQNQITSAEARQAWLKQYGMTQEQLDSLATRELRIEKYKQLTWGIKLESYFLSRKDKLDKVIYSLIRTQDIGIAQELYFRILEGEQSFAELARTYSQGPEAQTDGLIGPVELSVPHPNLAQILSLSQPGQLSPPTRVGDWLVLVRLEKFIPAQLDESMRRRLLNECFSNWLQEQLNQLNATVPVDSANQPLDSANQPIGQTVSQTVSQPLAQSASQSASQPASQPANQPANQPSDGSLGEPTPGSSDSAFTHTAP